MKRKTSLVAGILLVCLAFMLGILIVTKNDDDTRNSDTRDAAYNPAVDTSPRNRSTSPRRPVSAPQPAIESALTYGDPRIDAVMLIQDPALRLEAIRKRLGMDISDALYQKALAAYGYQNNSQRLLEIIGKLWMYDDPAAATAWAHRLQAAGATEPRTCVGNSAMFVGCLREDFTIDALAQWMHADRDRAMAWAKAQGIDPEVMERADANSAAINEKLRPKPAEEIVAELMRLEQRALAGAASSRELSILRDEIRGEFTRLVNTDLAAAIDFLNPTMVEGMATWAQLDPDGALLFAKVATWAQLDPDGALLFAKDMQDSMQRELTLCYVLPAWQLKYPDRCITEVVDLDTLPRYLDRLNSKLIEDLALRNPSAALKFAMEIEDPRESFYKIEDVIESSVRVSPTEVIKAVAGIADGKLRDRATGVLANEISKIDFQQAPPLYDQIANDDLRHRAIDYVLSYTRITSRSWQDTMSLIDRVPSVSAYRTKKWAKDIPQEDISAYRAWLVQANDSGKLTHERMLSGESATDAELQAQRESEYQEAIGTLDTRLKEKP